MKERLSHDLLERGDGPADRRPRYAHALRGRREASALVDHRKSAQEVQIDCCHGAPQMASPAHCSKCAPDPQFSPWQSPPFSSPVLLENSDVASSSCCSRATSSIIATTRDPAKLADLADLAARGVDVRAADFNDEASLTKAFSGADRALLVSTDALDQREAQQLRAVKALEAAGVKHVVYTSVPNPETTLAIVGPSHAVTEKALAASKLDYTVLRNNLHADLLFASLPGAVK